MKYQSHLIARGLLAFCLAMCICRATTSAEDGVANVSSVELVFRLKLDPAIYSQTKYTKPPQMAIWLEQPETDTIRTLWVSDCTGAGTWRSKTTCPVSLPFWVSRYNRETDTKGDPTLERPAADAITQPTPKEELQVAAEVPAGGTWDYFIEVNASGDYNDAFPAVTTDGMKDQQGNGEPSLVYQGRITAEVDASSVPKLAGRTEQFVPTDQLNADLDGITNAKRLLPKIQVTCRAANRSGEASSTDAVPGVVIDHQAASTGKYIGSPSIAILPDGSYVASHDIFGPGSQYSRTKVFGSSDGGQTWEFRSEVDGAFWSTLFVHQGSLYLMGVSGRYLSTVIRRSDDGGRSWTTPADRTSGVLLDDGGYHCSPQPVLVHNGRIWRAMEDNRGTVKGWAKHFRAFMMSAPVDADLLNAEGWTISSRVESAPRWLDGRFGGWLEGNAVVTPDGQIANILRVEFPKGGGKAAIVLVSDDGRTSSFDPDSGFIDLPGGCTKFTIRFDPESKCYWTLSNYMPPRHLENHPGATRNTLALASSADLRQWQVRSIVAYHPDTKHHGFQYPDWQFEGDDIVAVSRTAYDDGLGGAHNYHDANYLTFHRLENFRSLDKLDLPPMPPPVKVVVECDEFIVEGLGFQPANFDEDVVAFSNRNYLWKNVPERFRGWRVTQTDGGERAVITVTARQDTTLVAVTGKNQDGTDTTGWEVLEAPDFHYSTPHGSPMLIMQRTLAAGQSLTIPQTNWTGTLILIPPVEES